MRTISSVSTGRTRRFTTLACTTRLLPKLRNILILLYQVDYIIAGGLSAFQHATPFGLRLSARRLRLRQAACQHFSFLSRWARARSRFARCLSGRSFAGSRRETNPAHPAEKLKAEAPAGAC